MRTFKTFSIFSAIITALLLLNSCARKITFPVSTVVPAADASAKIKTDKNNNYVINLEVDNLADPERLTPPKKMYVAWIETSNNGTKNIGQLVASGSNGSLKTTTPFKPTHIFITAENEASITEPSSQVILRSNPID